ncbi:MAG: chloride channel protein [Actinomycetota bacterium]|nr:chloride channel protein [Actinomycetota bacterium]MDP2288231.1 chloride channel protein [Actinomycetota bacterium]
MDTPSQSQVIRLLSLAVVLGVLAAIAGSALLWVVDQGQEWFFVELPDSMGMDSAPWWLAAALLFVGASLVALAKRLPGSTGTGPLTGFHFDDPLSMVPSVILAAVATLVFGFVLGPEAPLIVLGSAIGAILGRKAAPEARMAMMFLGGAAALGAVLGNPFVAGFMILEFAAMGMVPALLIAPAMLALACSYLVQIGIWNIPGLGEHGLSVPGMPAYTSVQPWDIVVAILVAIVGGLIAIAVRQGALRFEKFSSKKVALGLYVATAVTAIVLLIAQEGFDIAQDQILFSGNTGMAQLVQETSIVAVIVILLGKALAYAVALGGGFRGGPIFPATFLGVAVGVLAVLILPSHSVSAMAAAGIGATAAAMLRLPATAALLGALLVGGAGAAIAPFAIIGAVIGYLIRVAVDAQLNKVAPGLGDNPQEQVSTA